MIRVETFRKRGSDLKGLGYIVQTGTEDGQATFKLTEKGWLSVVRGSL